MVKYNKDKQIVDSMLLFLKNTKTKELKALYKYICDLESDIENKNYEISKLKKEIQDLNDDIRDNYNPISKAEQYDMGECNFH